MKSGKQVSLFKISLALSSEDVPMEPIVRSMGLIAKHLHKRGEPIVLATSPARPIANKHYASVTHEKSSDEKDVSAWLDRTIRHINGLPVLADMIRVGTVEAMPWIGIMVHDPMPPPLRFDLNLVDAVTRLGGRILIEDYNRKDADGSPKKTWFG